MGARTNYFAIREPVLHSKNSVIVSGAMEGDTSAIQGLARKSPGYRLVGLNIKVIYDLQHR